MMQLSQVCKAVDGTLTGDDATVQNVSINTRAECKNRLFVALKGDNFDAHDFIDQAQQAGAGAVMVEHDVTTSLPCIKVASTHQALMDLAAWWRDQFDIPIIAVTGSVGKTTVKEMLGAIFAQTGPGVVTEGNLNNEIGVPITLMRLTPQDQYAIIEMGMNHAGEISRLSKMTRPTIALINNAGKAHLQELGSVEAVARAKGEIFDGLVEGGTAIINAEDAFAELWRSLVHDHRVVTFGLYADADVTGVYIPRDGKLTVTISAGSEQFNCRLHTVGEHNVRNAFAAVAVALEANVSITDIKAGIARYRPAQGRLTMIEAGKITLIDDTYNANPTSMLAAIKTLLDYPQSLLITGDMAELGETVEVEHRQLGEKANAAGIQNLYACGQYAENVTEGFGPGAKAFASQDELIAYLQQHPPAVTTLVKGSRSAKMERVVAALIDILQPGSSAATSTGPAGDTLC